MGGGSCANHRGKPPPLTNASASAASTFRRLPRSRSTAHFKKSFTSSPSWTNLHSFIFLHRIKSSVQLALPSSQSMVCLFLAASYSEDSLLRELICRELPCGGAKRNRVAPRGVRESGRTGTCAPALMARAACWSVVGHQRRRRIRGGGGRGTCLTRIGSPHPPRRFPRLCS